MSAPFPDIAAPRGSDPHGDVFQPKNVIYIEERNEHVPTWYVQHENPSSIRVKINGIPQDYTVADVPPERRWAINADGDVLAQSEFGPLMERKYDEYFRVVHGKQFPGSVKREFVPRVERYVAVKVDPVDKRRLMPQGYNPNATAGSTSKVLYDKDGENPLEGEDRLRLLASYYQDPKGKGRLKEHEIAEVEAYLREAGGGTVPVTQDDTAARLEVLTELLGTGDITQETYVKRVGALTGIAPIAGSDCKPTLDMVAKATVKKAKPKKKPIVMECGAEVWPFHKTRHIAKCEKCKTAE